MSSIAELVTAPIFTWDAVVCTSRVARDLYRHVLEDTMEHLRASVGATRFSLPQLPLIPLGVHLDDFSFSEAARVSARTRLGMTEDDVAVLFAGRLSFTGKAHPLPMLAGLEASTIRTGRRVHLVLFGRFPHPRVEEVLRAEAARFAPSVRLVVLDGAKDEDREAAWASADIFTSLSDNVQETFGLTPVEAMAARLPVVVSDWNGYKDTVRDGVDGYRIRTVAAPPGVGIDLADRFDMGLDSYDLYIGTVSQFVAVDVDSAADAYTQLVGDAALRRRMGEAGRRRAAETYAWDVVFRRYLALWEDLAERRRADVRVPGEDSRLRRPDRPDPFALFAGFPTFVLGDDTRVRLAAGATTEEAIARRGLGSVAFAATSLPPDDVIRAVLDRLDVVEAVTLRDVAAALPGARAGGAARAVAWLAKMGLVRLLP